MRGRCEDAKGRRMETHGTKEPAEAAKKEEMRGKTRWRKDRERERERDPRGCLASAKTRSLYHQRRSASAESTSDPSFLASFLSQAFFSLFLLFIVEAAVENHDADDW